MHQFLKSIADAYVMAEPLTLDEYTFVFPNTRSAAYFRKYLSETTRLEKGRIKTMCITLTEMVEKGSGRKRASKERLLFTLYKAYCNVRKAQGNEAGIRPFDSFGFWGEILLRDFSEVDKYMVNPDEIFRNVRQQKEIQTFYLTEEQIEIIRQFWGEDPYWQRLWEKEKKGEELPFWNHMEKKSATIEKFSQLWQLLAPLYHEFRRLLDLSGECYPGMAYRIVANTLRSGERLRFNPRKYVFIGFNRLSMSEHMIFDCLDRQDKAHFYWDYDPIFMNVNSGNIAGRFIGKYVERFTSSLAEVKLPVRQGNRVVDVIAVPSNVGQAKVAGRLLDEPDTAIVLASDDLMLPMAQSVPEAFEKINITMGYPLRYSAISQLFALLMSLQLRARTDSDGETHFFRDDVMALLSSPLVQSAFLEECRAADEYLRRNHIFNLPASLAAEAIEFEKFRPLLMPLPASATTREAAKYVKTVLSFVCETPILSELDRKCAEVIASQSETLGNLADEFDAEMSAHTFLRMIERTILQRSMPLEGKSFDAMQIMGVLETRALGFDHVVMLSMNDTVFPGHQVGRSFIPETLRKAYGMATRDHLEVDSAYYFYRLLSAARHMTLIYDSRSGGLRSGEMSRYIFQLKYLDFPGVKVNMTTASFSGSTPREQKALLPADIEVTKTPRVMERLNRYRDASMLKSHSLSASTIKKYISCPLSFYLERVEDLYLEDEEKEDIDAGIMGNLSHQIAERVYTQLAERSGGEITGQMLRELIADGFDGMLRREIRRALLIHSDRMPEFVTTSDGERIENPRLADARLSDKSEFFINPVTKYITRLFVNETTPFTFRHAELSRKFVWKDVAPGIDVNFTMKIDRLDSIVEDGREIVRVVDYKTGSDVTEFSDVGQLFAHCDPDPKHPRAIFQLLTYCAAFKDYYGEKVDSGTLRPQVFSLRNVDKTGFPLITIKGQKEPLDNFGQIEGEFREALSKMFTELFNPDEPFRRAQDKKCCTYCNFRRFCHVNPDMDTNF